MEFSRQVYWSGTLFPSLGDLPEPGIKPKSPALQADSLPTEPLFETCTTTFIFPQTLGWLRQYIPSFLV